MVVRGADDVRIAQHFSAGDRVGFMDQSVKRTIDTEPGAVATGS
jgi:hypothetical protein